MTNINCPALAFKPTRLRILIFQVFVFLSSTTAWALPAAPAGGGGGGGSSGSFTEIPIYADLTVLGGRGALQNGGLSASQEMNTAAGGLTFAVGGMFFLGAQYEYRQIYQFSDVKIDDGNFSGFRQFVAPAFGFRIDDFVVKINYQTTGDYQLSKKTASDTLVTYGSVKGYAVNILYNMLSGVHAILNYETVAFEVKNDSASPSIKLSSPLQSNQMGLGVGYVF